MIEIAQKGRAAKILLFIFAQKIDSTNIPSNVLANLQTRVLMKTDSDFNINNTIGKKEDLENITVLNPDSFPRGRAIIKNGFTSEKVLVQFPLIELKKEYHEMLMAK
jgi:S-DNA-T family DNA segregation ATPase FtsK/SpoIIIE